MAAVTVALERRQDRRLSGGSGRWESRAVLRPGQLVSIINISRRAALVESSARLRPGALTELQLVGRDRRECVRGRLERCCVTGLDPLRYRGVVVFETHLELDERVGA